MELHVNFVHQVVQILLVNEGNLSQSIFSYHT